MVIVQKILCQTCKIYAIVQLRVCLYRVVLFYSCFILLYRRLNFFSLFFAIKRFKCLILMCISTFK